MFKLKSVKTVNASGKVLEMGKMKPLEIGKVISNYSKDTIVMRTADKDNVEIMNISDPKPDKIYDDDCDFMVELLPPGTELILKIL